MIFLPRLSSFPPAPQQSVYANSFLFATNAAVRTRQACAINLSNVSIILYQVAIDQPIAEAAFRFLFSVG